MKYGLFDYQGFGESAHGSFNNFCGQPVRQYMCNKRNKLVLHNMSTGPFAAHNVIHLYIDIYIYIYLFVYLYLYIWYPLPPMYPRLSSQYFSISALGRHGFLGCPCFHAFLRNLSCRTACVNGIGRACRLYVSSLSFNTKLSDRAYSNVFRTYSVEYASDPRFKIQVAGQRILNLGSEAYSTEYV